MTNASALLGGWAAWLQAGYPIEGTQVPTPSATDVAIEEMTALGSPDAPVTIEEFSDFQCPYCRLYVMQTLPLIKEMYIETGLVRYVVRDFPLTSHPNGAVAAEAARCAEQIWQGRHHLGQFPDQNGSNHRCDRGREGGQHLLHGENDRQGYLGRMWRVMEWISRA